MILADSSIWIDHIRKSEDNLIQLLREGRLVMHPWIQGEIALGSIASRAMTLRVLGAIEQLPVCPPTELLEFIEDHDLSGKGIGYVDAQLLASSLASQARLWTRDKRLAAQADRLKLLANLD